MDAGFERMRDGPTAEGRAPVIEAGRRAGAADEEARPESRASRVEPATLVDVRDVSRRFGRVVALDAVSLAVGSGEIHALLGPNGAGKTTLLRLLTGLVDADSGHLRVAGLDPGRSGRELRRRVGLVPSGDRTLYLRVSGLENLVFFGRLHGLRRRAAARRAHEVLEAVGLAEAARARVGVYSHGMQKRLAMARALLVSPDVLLVDEATHDLDPEAAETVRNLVRDLAARGTAVVWTTQRVDEVRGFAGSVTLLAQGRTRFAGSVADLMAHAAPRRFLLRLADTRENGRAPGPALDAGLAGLGSISQTGADATHFVMALEDGAVLGDALAAIRTAGFQLLSCRDERSEVEEAFLALTRREDQ
ncbi:MAG TPA: ABC transporter ATP-binding protein [Gaiellaceae bacterium]|nr:ABC transporter ATP-binding protein [Gaiellaceae bacterium]